jgi:hypothetical protein
MSDDRGPPGDIKPPPPPPPRRHPVATALLVFIGIILLLPGLCSLVFMSMGGGMGEFAGLWVVCFVISAGGVLMLYAASR